jgi:hypothetical protein
MLNQALATEDHPVELYGDHNVSSSPNSRQNESISALADVHSKGNAPIRSGGGNLKPNIQNTLFSRHLGRNGNAQPHKYKTLITNHHHSHHVWFASALSGRRKPPLVRAPRTPRARHDT